MTKGTGVDFNVSRRERHEKVGLEARKWSLTYVNCNARSESGARARRTGNNPSKASCRSHEGSYRQSRVLWRH